MTVGNWNTPLIIGDLVRPYIRLGDDLLGTADHGENLNAGLCVDELGFGQQLFGDLVFLMRETDTRS